MVIVSQKLKKYNVLCIYVCESIYGFKKQSLWHARNITCQDRSRYIYSPNLSLESRIFKWSNAHLNFLSFSFTEIGCPTKARQPDMPYYFIHSHRENKWIHALPKGINIKRNCKQFHLRTLWIYNNINQARGPK